MHHVNPKNALPYAFIIAVAIFMFRGIFAPGFMSGYDNSFHYYDAYYLTKTLIPQYHWISGWSMQCLGGFPVLVDYYQVGFLIIAILNKILFLSLNLSYKTMVLASYIVLGVGFYKISSERFGKTAALLITTCLMLQKDIYYDRILAGIWNNYLALGVFFIFLHMLDKNIKTLTIRKSLILGLLLGILTLTHLYVAVFAFIILFIYLFPYLQEALRENRLKKALFNILPISHHPQFTQLKYTSGTSFGAGAGAGGGVPGVGAGVGVVCAGVSAGTVGAGEDTQPITASPTKVKRISREVNLFNLHLSPRIL